MANVEAYSRQPRSLSLNYDFLPDGYGDTLVLTESLDEIMADKLVSLVNNQRYVRHRDRWDLRWLKQQGAAVTVGDCRPSLRAPVMARPKAAANWRGSPHAAGSPRGFTPRHDEWWG